MQRIYRYDSHAALGPRARVAVAVSIDDGAGAAVDPTSSWEELGRGRAVLVSRRGCASTCTRRLRAGRGGGPRGRLDSSNLLVPAGALQFHQQD